MNCDTVIDGDHGTEHKQCLCAQDNCNAHFQTSKRKRKKNHNIYFRFSSANSNFSSPNKCISGFRSLNDLLFLAVDSSFAPEQLIVGDLDSKIPFPLSKFFEGVCICVSICVFVFCVFGFYLCIFLYLCIWFLFVYLFFSIFVFGS